MLTNTFRYGDRRAFEFNDAEGYAIDVEDQIRTLVMGAFDGDFFGNGKVVVLGCFQSISQTV